MSREQEVALGSIIQEAFGTGIAGRGVNLVRNQALSVLDRFNSESGQTFTLIKRGGHQVRLLFPLPQKDQIVTLLRENKDQFEPILPFRVMGDELLRLKMGDGEVLETVIMRMYKFGLMYARKGKIPVGQDFELVESVINHPSTWQVLLSSQPPVTHTSGFGKLYRTSIYRRVVNFHRDQLRAQKPKEKIFRPKKEPKPRIDKRPRLAALDRLISENEDFYKDCVSELYGYRDYIHQKYGLKLSNMQIAKNLNRNESAVKAIGVRARNHMVELAVRKGLWPAF